MMSVDSHIHFSHFLYDGEFPYLSYENGGYVIRRGTREQLIEAVRTNGVRYCIDPAIDMESNFSIRKLTERYPGFLFAAVGVHPTRTYRYKKADRNGKRISVKLAWKQRKRLADFLNNPGVVAIGETGLDYHLPRNEQHRFRQKKWFVYQIKLAHRYRLPLILHIRDADADAAGILKKYRHLLCGGVCHCFNGSAETAETYTQLGLKLGIGGSLLMDTPKKQELEQAVIHTSLENILLETDGPYVKPACFGIPKKELRKARNSSLILPDVARRIAELKRVSPEEVLTVTSENAVRLFGLTDKTGCE